MIINTLQHFHDGYIHTTLVRRNRSAPATVQRFLLGALTTNLHGLYLASPRRGVPDMLRSIGRADLAESTEDILEKQIGDMRLREILEHYRSEDVAHPTFRFKCTYGTFDPIEAPASEVAAFNHALGRLLRRTAAVYRFLQRSYPEIDLVIHQIITPEQARAYIQNQPLPPQS
jgi:hypothetical protein